MKPAKVRFVLCFSSILILGLLKLSGQPSAPTSSAKELANAASGFYPLLVPPGNTLYGASRAGQLFTINLTTGAGTFVGNLPIAGCCGVPPGDTEIVFNNLNNRAFVQFVDGVFAGQEFDINTGAAIGAPVPNAGSYDGLEWVGSTLYGTAIFGAQSPSQLRTLNPFTGTSALVGATGIGPIAGLALDKTTGIMFGISGGAGGGTSSLVTLNLSTGAATVIGPVGFNGGSLEFGPDGNLYAGSVGGTGNLYRINKSTGAGTLVGATGFINVTGLALDSSCAPDTTPPSITCPGGITKFTDSGQSTATVDPGTPVASDKCSSLSVTGVRNDGKPLNAPYPIGVTLITWTARDAAGNTASCAQSIAVMVPSGERRKP
jgi:hypothetical protein